MTADDTERPSASHISWVNQFHCRISTLHSIHATLHHTPFFYFDIPVTYISFVILDELACMVQAMSTFQWGNMQEDCRLLARLHSQLANSSRMNPTIVITIISCRRISLDKVTCY